MFREAFASTQGEGEEGDVLLLRNEKHDINQGLYHTVERRERDGRKEGRKEGRCFENMQFPH